MNQTARTLLVIDDDRIFCQLLPEYFAGTTIEVLSAQTAAQGIELCRSRRIDIVLLDENLPDGEGHLLCPDILKANEDSKIIFITAYPSFQHAVQALKAGAFDYLSKPFDLEELQLAVTHACRALELEKLRSVATYRSAKEREQYVPVGEYADNGRVSELIGLASGVSSPVLLTGETGTGKGVVARVIHYNGPRGDAPFIPVNCAAIPENLIEAELFGSEKGAFTGAVATRKGIFELAEGGTLFLDEIGAMPLQLQSKLLGVLEDGRIKRLGGQVFIPIHVRIISATNADLEEMIAARSFRQDLFYRIGVLQIQLPPLRHRRQDIAALCRHILDHSGDGRHASLAETELEALRQYSWPGNIRELRNILERSLLLHGRQLRPSELIRLDGTGSAVPAVPESAGSFPSLEEIERRHIARALEVFSGNWTHAARALGVSISTLKRKVRESHSV